MSIEEKRREAFEAAFVKKHGFGRLTASASADAHAMYESALWAWNAALDSVVIELPNDIEPSEVAGLDDRPLMNAAAVQHAIESAGLKVKQ